MSDISFSELRRHDLMRSLVKNRVIADAVSDEPIAIEDLENAREAFMRNKNLTDEKSLQQFLANSCLDKDALEWRLRLPLLIKSYCKANFLPKAETQFLKHKNQLDKVVYSLIRVRDYFLAREYYFRIQSGEANFADLAANFSEGIEKVTNGVVGPVSLTKAHPQLAERLRVSKPGVPIEPFKVGEWWIVSRLEESIPAEFSEQIANELANELFEQWIEDETSAKIQRLYVQLS